MIELNLRTLDVGKQLAIREGAIGLGMNNRDRSWIMRGDCLEDWELREGGSHADGDDDSSSRPRGEWSSVTEISGGMRKQMP